MTNSRLDTLADGFVFLEGRRWHAGRLWLSDMWGHTVFTLTEAGESTAIARVPNRPSGLSFLPDGGVLSEYADLSTHATGDINDTVCDASGNIYVGNFGYDIEHGEPPRLADLVMVTAKRECRVVARGLSFPNGAVLSEDGRTLIVAESFGHCLTAFDRAADGTLSNRRVWAALGERTPDGICLDAEGAIWVSSVMTDEFLRVLLRGSSATTLPPPCVSVIHRSRQGGPERGKMRLRHTHNR